MNSFNTKSIKFKLLMSLVLIAFIPICFIFILSYKYHKDTIYKFYDNELEIVVEDARNTINDSVFNKVHLLKLAADERFIKDIPQDIEQANIELRQYLKNNEFIQLSLLDKDGIVLVSSDRETIGQRHTNNALNMLAYNDFYIGDFFQDNVTGAMAYNIYVTYFNKAGELSGTVVGTTTAQHIYKDITPYLQRSPYLNIYMFSEDGDMVVNSAAKYGQFDFKESSFINYFNGEGNSSFYTDNRYKNMLGYYSKSAFIKDLNKNWSILLSQDGKIAAQNLAKIRNIMIVSIASIFILLVIASAFISDKITAPIISVSKAAKKITSGQLKVKINVISDDELGELSKDFNEMVSGLVDIILKMKNITESIAQASINTLDISNRQSHNIFKQSESVAETTAAAEKLTVSSEYISDSTSVVSAAAKNSMEGMAKIKSNINETVTVITNLSERSKKISQITELITDVSDQTNLLAVNAAIEAKRAGEHGLGFSVIAAEIRKLSNSAAVAANNINKLVEAIQHEMNSAIISMYESSRSVAEEVQTARDTADSAEKINGSISQQFIVTQQISASMNEINSAMQQISEGTSYSQESARRLASLGNELKSITDKFDV